jgi:hypothetical protein
LESTQYKIGSGLKGLQKEKRASMSIIGVVVNFAKIITGHPAG